MKIFVYVIALVWVCGICSVDTAWGADLSRPVQPGEPGVRPFWNSNASRFIYAPAFAFEAVPAAAKYRFVVRDTEGKDHAFTAEKPWMPLSPVWNEIPEGATKLTVEAIDTDGKPIGKPSTREFYRSPGFSGDPGKPVKRYDEAGRAALAAIFQAPHVQHWLKDGKPDRTYARYCYPNKVIGGLCRAMCAYSRVAENEKDRAAAMEIARRTADYLVSVRLPADSPYANCPPTYLLNVNKPTGVTPPRVRDHWLMVPSAIDAALALLDVHDLTGDAKYLDAAELIADALVKTQQPDGTWPLMVDYTTGKETNPNRLIPTWIIFFFDRLADQYHLTRYADSRKRAWSYVVDNPLKTYAWDAQFEDIKLREPYVNLAREQACDVAWLLMNNPQRTTDDVAQAEGLLRFAEDQFIVWAPLKNPEAWEKIMPNRRKNCDVWITPCVLEQYHCYDPVARSSAILINAYLKAHVVTKNPDYLARAKALANGMLAGQQWLASDHNGNGEIPTWNMKRPPINWLNNSYYAAEAILNLAKYTEQHP